jgi:hypothetical protein
MVILWPQGCALAYIYSAGMFVMAAAFLVAVWGALFGAVGFFGKESQKFPAAAGLVLGIVVAYSIFAMFYTAGRPCIYESSDRGMAVAVGVFLPCHNIEMAERVLDEYKKRKGTLDVKLIRTTSAPWYSPLNWPNNFTNPMWKIPYAKPSPKPNYSWRDDFLHGVDLH